MSYTVRPISDRTWLNPSARKPTRFDSTWTATLELLDSEISHLRGRALVLEVDVQEKHLRMDGMLRADARAASPAVVVAFESKHGPLLYRCDRFDTSYYDQGPAWQHNIRAVALTLQALRAVDRYGASASGEQYRGYKAIGAGPATAMPPSMSRETALATIARLSADLPGHYAHDWDMQRYADHPDEIRKDWKHARARCHPDRHNGDQTLWDQVEQAARVLGVLS